MSISVRVCVGGGGEWGGGMENDVGDRKRLVSNIVSNTSPAVKCSFLIPVLLV